MYAKDALLRRDSETERKSVVPSSAMHVQAVAAASPEAVVRKLQAEETQKGPREPEAQEPYLATVRVPGQNEIPFAFWQMSERARIVQQNDAHKPRLPWMLTANARQMLGAAPPDEVSADDLDGPCFGVESPLLVHEQRDPVFSHGARDGLGRFVIMVAIAREDTSGHRAKR
jgi:hypothetical protein